MNNSNRFCTLQGHERQPVFHICTLFDCKQMTRWCCKECFAKRIHDHNLENNFHIMIWEEFLNKVRNGQECIKKDYLDRLSQQNLLRVILKECQMLEKCLIDHIGQTEKQIQDIFSEDDQARFNDYLCSLSNDNFEQLDDYKINQLLDFNYYKFNQNGQQQLYKPLDDIIKSIEQIEFIIKDYQDNQNDNSNKHINLKDRRYNIQEIDYTNTNYYASSISKNEQYLVFGGHDKLLKIYDIKLKKIVKEIKLDYCIYDSQFTQDSSQLYVGLNCGYVCGYDVQDNFKEIYKQQIQSSDIYNIITIKNEYLITCSDDYSIIKTQIKSKQQIFKLTGQTDWIYAIDYNDIDDIIVSGSDDKSIKLWDYSNGNLYKWKLDLINKDLIKLQQFSDENKIFNFYQVNQDQNILLICSYYATILNQQGETINLIEHGCNYPSSCVCKQLDDLKYIMIRTNQQIILAIAQD